MAESNLDQARVIDAEATGGEDAFDRAVRPRTLAEPSSAGLRKLTGRSVPRRKPLRFKH